MGIISLLWQEASLRSAIFSENEATNLLVTLPRGVKSVYKTERCLIAGQLKKGQLRKRRLLSNLMGPCRGEMKAICTCCRNSGDWDTSALETARVPLTPSTWIRFLLQLKSFNPRTNNLKCLQILERSFHLPASEGMRFDNLSKWKYSTWDFAREFWAQKSRAGPFLPLCFLERLSWQDNSCSTNWQIVPQLSLDKPTLARLIQVADVKVPTNSLVLHDWTVLLDKIFASTET